MTNQPRLNIPQIAEYLGVGVQAAKKWRGHTIAALKAAGQLDSKSPTVPLPTNALPIPSNQAEHVRDGVDPRWEIDLINEWAVRTQRRHPVTGAPMRPPPRGPKPRAQRQPVSV